ncbi:MAG: Dabb family protein [Verrucomicrobia bacterium]|nr:Dabb family protein [Cytophagales bacterium]
MQNLHTGFVHTVYFWLKNPDSQADKAALEAGIQTLLAVDAIKMAYIGSPAETRRPVIDHTYSVSLTFIFNSKAEQDVYQSHPIHLKFVETCSQLWDRVQVYDATSVR